LNEPRTRYFWTELEIFKRDDSRHHFIFPSTISPFERRIIHIIAQDMGFAHRSVGESESRQLYVVKTSLSSPTGLAGGGAGGGIANQNTLVSMDVGRTRGLNRAATFDFADQNSRAASHSYGGPSSRHGPTLEVPNSPDVSSTSSNNINNNSNGNGNGNGNGNSSNTSTNPNNTGTHISNHAMINNNINNNNINNNNNNNSMSNNSMPPPQQSLRTAKSFADLRSFSPTLSQGSSSHAIATPVIGQPGHNNLNFNNGVHTPGATTANNSTVSLNHINHIGLSNGHHHGILGGLPTSAGGYGGGYGPISPSASIMGPSGLTSASSANDLYSDFGALSLANSSDVGTIRSNPGTIGSQRPSQGGRNPANIPERQPRGPLGEREPTSGFGRITGHNTQGSGEFTISLVAMYLVDFGFFYPH